ncbi:hypothetical protein [Alistipes sp.]|uniref:hypothetical protein n=1 Tax=Alistipes sp. TaxID=1872444 RepID=UPI003AF05D97
MKNDTSTTRSAHGAALLKAAAALLFLLAAGHLVCLFRLDAVFRLYGIEPVMRRLAEQGAALPYLATAGIAAGLAGCGLYALSAAGVVRRRPLLYPLLFGIGTVFLLRTAAGLARMTVSSAFPATEWTAALTAGIIGLLLLLGGLRARKKYES